MTAVQDQLRPWQSGQVLVSRLHGYRVAAFTLVNEVVNYAVNEPWSATMSALDVVNTMFWPMLPFLLARRGRGVGTKV